MARVGFDLDNVIYPFVEEFCSYVDVDPKTVTQWRFYKDFDWTEERFDEELAWWHDDGGLRCGYPIGGVESRQAMQELGDAGHEIFIVTARNPSTEEDTRYWLSTFHIPYHHLVFEKDKTAVDVDYMLDDKWENFDALVRKPGVFAFLMDQPWNRAAASWLSQWRVSSVRQYVDKVLASEPQPDSEPIKLDEDMEEIGFHKGDLTVLATGDPVEIKWGDVKALSKPMTMTLKATDKLNREVVHTYFGVAPSLPKVDEWAEEREDVLERFAHELRKATGDGSKKRQSGEKPPWYLDGSHEGAIFSHITKWKRGEKVDPDSGAHPLVHAAWRCLAIACAESGNTPDPMSKVDNERNAA